jgi:cation:H+ antiporter
MSYLLLIAGLALLFVGGEFLVRGAVGLALKFQISILVIGLTVVAFATSAPELLVSLQAALNNHADIALGNVVGSNIANVGLIMGFTALLFELPVHKTDYRFDWAFMVVMTLLLFVFLYFFGGVNFFAGALFTTLLLAYNYYKIKSSRSTGKKVVEADIDTHAAKESMFKVLAFLLLGVLGLRYGAMFFVEGASGIALDFGVSERAISVTVVAFGTSVPELAASIIAAVKNEKDLAIGNLIGSNIFNILAVLGITALVTPISMHDLQLIRFDYWWMLAFSVALFPMMGLFTKGKLGRGEGLLLFAAYVAYIVLTIIKL